MQWLLCTLAIAFGVQIELQIAINSPAITPTVSVAK